MKCPKCGSETNPSASLCGRCGALMRPSSNSSWLSSTDVVRDWRWDETNTTDQLHKSDEDMHDSDDKAPIGQKYAIVIGTTYKGTPIRSLPATKYDVLYMKKVLVESFGFPKSNVTVIAEDAVTKANVENALHNLNESGLRASDQVLVYFSGHGGRVDTNTGDGRTHGYLITHDARSGGSFARTCVSMRAIWEPLEQCRANQRLLICDACHSGHLADNKSLSAPSLLDHEFLSLIDGPKRMSPRAAVQVITAGRRDEVVAAHVDDTRLSPFTHLLLTRMADLAQHGQQFTAKSLGEWLQAHYPEFVRENNGGYVSEPLVENVCGSRGNFVFTPAQT
jgi:hypothetical protein